MKIFNKKGDFDNNQGSRPGMHQAICSACGNKCEVPFRPTGDRPVFCNSCFEKHGQTNPKRSDSKNYQRSGFDKKRMFEAICSKCGNKCEVPFRPTGDKPVYCSQCFGKGSSSLGKAPDQSKQQFEILNAKLDKILKALTPAIALPAPKVEKVIKAKKDKVIKVSVKKPKAKKRK